MEESPAFETMMPGFFVREHSRAFMTIREGTMTFSRISLRTLSIITLTIAIALGLGRDASATEVKIVGRTLFVDGAPFTIKGVNYSPVPVGTAPESTPPYGDYFTADHSHIYDRDLPLLRDMGGKCYPDLWLE
jgi:hypothetical protein